MPEQFRELGLKKSLLNEDNHFDHSKKDILPSLADEKKQRRLFIYSALGSFFGMALFILILLWLSFKVFV